MKEHVLNVVTLVIDSMMKCYINEKIGDPHIELDMCDASKTMLHIAEASELYNELLNVWKYKNAVKNEKVLSAYGISCQLPDTPTSEYIDDSISVDQFGRLTLDVTSYEIDFPEIKYIFETVNEAISNGCIIDVKNLREQLIDEIKIGNYFYDDEGEIK